MLNYVYYWVNNYIFKVSTISISFSTLATPFSTLLTSLSTLDWYPRALACRPALIPVYRDYFPVTASESKSSWNPSVLLWSETPLWNTREMSRESLRLIDFIMFYAVSTIFRPYNGGCLSLYRIYTNIRMISLIEIKWEMNNEKTSGIYIICYQLLKRFAQDDNDLYWNLIVISNMQWIWFRKNLNP